MKPIYWLTYSLVLMLLLAAAGCVAPPAENATIFTNPNSSGPQQGTPTQAFVTEIALSDNGTAVVQPAGYSTFAPPTRIPSDITCRIYQKNLPGYNSSAFLFNLQNPPMYINYTVFPVNETYNRSYWDNYEKKTKTLVYSDFSHLSWFEITVLNNDTNEEYLKEGFGEYHGLSRYTNRTIKVLKSGNLRIEMRGSNLINASASVWVKPIGNFNESRLSEFTDCFYWDSHRDSLPVATTTTVEGAIYTWTPENKVTPE